MSFLEKAVKDRVIILDQENDRLVYLPHEKERVLSNPEELVQLETFLELIYNYGYPAHKIKVCEKLQIGSSTREADIIVYRDDACKDPFVVIECKKEKISDSTFESAIDQGFSYAAVFNAEYVWATSGDEDAAFEVWHETIHERIKNRINKIPRYEANKSFWYRVKKPFKWMKRKPILADTLLYGLVVMLCTILLSNLAVIFHSEIVTFLKPYIWNGKPVDHNDIYNLIVLAATFISLVFGGLFMRSHQLFKVPMTRKAISYALIALIFFVPSWFIGISNSDPNWWTENRFLSRAFQTKTYLWPYIKAFVPQLIAIFGLVWIVSRGNRK